MINQLKHFYFKFGYKRQNNLKIYKTKKKNNNYAKQMFEMRQNGATSF